jgi:hypothetical protein
MNRDIDGLCELRNEAADSGIMLSIDDGGNCAATDQGDCEFFSGEDVCVDSTEEPEEFEEAEQPAQQEHDEDL